MTSRSVKRPRNFSLGKLVTLLDGRSGQVTACIVLVGVAIEGGGMEYVISSDLRRKKTGGRTTPKRTVLEGRTSVAGLNNAPCAPCGKDTLHSYGVCRECGTSSLSPKSAPKRAVDFKI